MSRDRMQQADEPADAGDAPDEHGYSVVERRFWSRGTESAEEGRSAGESGRDDQSAELEEKARRIAELEEKLAQQDDTLRDLAARHSRAVREFEDAKSRMRRDISAEIERGKQSFVTELLEVLDNLDRAIEVARDNAAGASLLKGVEVARDQFLAKLKNLGVVRLEPLGEPFDPARDEAIATLPAEDAAQAGRVVSVVRPCYKMGDQLLRPAMVVVAALPA